MAQPTLKIDSAGSITAVLDGVEGTSISPRDAALILAHVLTATGSAEAIDPGSNIQNIHLEVNNRDGLDLSWDEYGQHQSVSYGASTTPYAAALIEYLEDHGEASETMKEEILAAISNVNSDFQSALNHAETRITSAIIGG